MTALQGNPFRPFCSERCKLTDFGNWASERYRVPGPSLDTELEQGGVDGGEDDNV